MNPIRVQPLAVAVCGCACLLDCMTTIRRESENGQPDECVIDMWNRWQIEPEAKVEALGKAEHIHPASKAKAEG